MAYIFTDKLRRVVIVMTRNKGMFRISKFNVCILGMLVGIGLISALPFVGLSCRWCTAGG
jgi:hypothetical protein